MSPPLVVDPATQRVLAGEPFDMPSLTSHASPNVRLGRSRSIGWRRDLAIGLMRRMRLSVVRIGHGRTSGGRMCRRDAPIEAPTGAPGEAV